MCLKEKETRVERSQKFSKNGKQCHKTHTKFILKQKEAIKIQIKKTNGKKKIKKNKNWEKTKWWTKNNNNHSKGNRIRIN